ncbi:MULTISPECIES: UDP-N-acetylmuramoyl-L-alanyl-D-glutamate--2,6-diaminopimelate ligase [unclassified Granulicatella]|uniref:UDP-N-acetylmuramoyl-L-alanyl-D-glutamate--2, 6-diaminopimelate ligase n=1 Tax=unclassified Granulicatella TaxID=2630493 RepID=UPI001073C28A|nr:MULTISPECIES: UDP-N-acetylmuramoyl-L-alanyl-D-glutamate--2,6-diaminopimelate ligase [unclassified Granulicatella]MBF0781001.1 UDP-N-acetylmuramoyl-L-alanyl-D-glutamate--2,6-diaminopimelate ligase [Granulicatella sp. 19428wC4_WM01]TFU92717.1 UDP-N-acetylmuramoyl-L-alanyl-D-glutamate--2,6-diaminopimelate ligase [Granulicatella sp. WM01]
MNVNELVQHMHIIKQIGNQQLLEMTIKDLSYNTNTVHEKSIFFALQGRTLDGATFIPRAYELGSRVFVSQTEVDVPEDALLIIVKDSRYALSQASNIFFNYPSRSLKVIGVTGTKGKTTTTTLLYKILTQAGISAGVIGTNGIHYANMSISTSNTTPESYELHKTMHLMREAGVQVCFMEVSSQGLMMNRVEHIDFDIAVFTNMAHDHIGELEHPTFENYLYWKTHLFELTKVALVNQDDAYVNHFKTSKVYTYSIDNASDFQASQIEYLFAQGQTGMQFQVNSSPIHALVHLPVPGKFNIYNALVVIAIAWLLDVNVQETLHFLAKTTVSGRMESISNQKGVLAILDYAHNGFSLENVVQTLQQYTYKRLLILFGSVGDRSQTRRKELGDVVAKYADIAMITSDNPGHEDPMRIIDDIYQSFVGSTCQVYKEPDRQKAIEKIISLSKEGDIIIFAGKGHETYQLIGDEKVPFHEKEIIEHALHASVQQ